LFHLGLPLFNSLGYDESAIRAAGGYLSTKHPDQIIAEPLSKGCRTGWKKYHYS
jgi:hypothetical protein